MPVRKFEDGELVIDMALLNWIEISYPKRVTSNDAQQEYVHGGGTLACDLPPGTWIYGSEGRRIEVDERLESLSLSDRRFWVVKDWRRPKTITARRGASLVEKDNQADYLMIAHERLIDAVRPLAEFYRQESGYAVELIDVEEIYDRFGHGVTDPYAIRDFLRFAAQEWRKPAPRFVLIVGDASWDTKHDRAIKSHYERRPGVVGRFDWTPYDKEERNDRNLIPTGTFFDTAGHAASDNFLVCLNDDDYLPDMAIGRFAAVTLEETRNMVAKSIAYHQARHLGPWRRKALWITNESVGFQNTTDRVVKSFADSGFVNHRIYPKSAEVSNEHHSKNILDALNQGQYLVYFFGHGGRYIWRTGPPDLKKNHDLFTLDHLDQLKPTHAYPIIMSFTCFSAPFDHPSADSIGEKFLRLADRGSVAFLGASWRVSPSFREIDAFTKATLEHETIGEAVMQVKRGLRSRRTIELYNLLGDPALPLIRSQQIRMTVDSGNPARVVVHSGGESLTGNGVLTWVDEYGAPIAETSFELKGERVDVPAPDGVDGAVQVQGYVWNRESWLEAWSTVAWPATMVD